ncbi:LuxR family transcriptional regulator [Nocardioides sp. Kera G14]|uniref:LuxR family transcriptional regulator n=1 Tax=Nocardioides sp. Kera G14 TaxID=2884264 RepID=UPI001D10592E|nr:LuxR family transcriptional regulator [Nocardioides sp. Kera G14]UDY23328.1 LuxR family transcriptional regulator [Nocardioides sp. Kera G14]
MGDYSADQRALFEAESIPLYEEIVAQGGIETDDPRLVAGSSARPAFDLLAELSLVHLDEEAGRWLPEDPTAAQARVVSPMSIEGARLLEESSHWTRGFSSLAQAWRSSSAADERGPFTYMRGRAIGPYLESLVAECQEELLTAQPQTGRDTSPSYTVQVAQGERDLLARGAKLLTLYQHSARRSSATREYVAAVTELGGEIRTLDEFFNRIIVVDRRIAVIPAPDDLSVAMAVREPTVVAYLVDVFLRSWERARPFNARDDQAVRQIAVEQRAMTMRMLIEGYSDPVSAKRLGVSPRTYAGYISDLKEEFEAETRFQLGYTIGQQGITPDSLSTD